MANRLLTNIAGKTSRSNIAKVGMGTSINMYQEVQDTSEHSCVLLMRTIDGMVTATQLTGKCRGMFTVSRAYNNEPGLYAVYDQKLYYISKANEATEIGDIESFNTECKMCETGGYGSAHPHLIITDGTSVYAVNVGLPLGDQQANLRRIPLPLRVNTEATYIQPTHCAYLYGYLIINDSSTDAWYKSYQYPFESYSEDDAEYNDLFQIYTDDYKDYGFITYSEWTPDNTLALCSNGSYLFTFGSRSYQIFSYNNDVNNPFSSPNNAASNIGVKAVNSLCNLGNITIWLGSSDLGDSGIYMLNGTTLSRISTKDLEREFLKLDQKVAYAQMWQEQQHIFYAITFESDKLTYVYDITEEAWHNRCSLDQMNLQSYWRYKNATFCYDKVYFGTTDALCYMDQNVYKEHDGRPILKLRRGGVLTSNGMPFFINSANIIINNGQHSFNDNYSDFELNPRITIRYSWDGSTWSDYEDGYCGKIGEYEYNTIFYSLGFGKYFTLEISTTEEIPLSIMNLQINYSEGSNLI